MKETDDGDTDFGAWWRCLIIPVSRTCISDKSRVIPFKAKCLYFGRQSFFFVDNKSCELYIIFAIFFKRNLGSIYYLRFKSLKPLTHVNIDIHDRIQWLITVFLIISVTKYWKIDSGSPNIYKSIIFKGLKISSKNLCRQTATFEFESEGR